jgi:hypothetical protein
VGSDDETLPLLLDEGEQLAAMLTASQTTARNAMETRARKALDDTLR